MDTFQQEEKILLKIKRRIVRELNDFTIDDVYESNPCIERDLHMIKFRDLSIVVLLMTSSGSTPGFLIVKKAMSWVQNG